jgi:lipase
VFVSRFGSGRPILCLHGIEAHGTRFMGMAAYLDDAQVVAPDLRGHGRSHMAGPWTVEQHVADVLPLLEQLGPETVLLGHSYGGVIAWRMADAAPTGISGLVLVDPPIGVDPEFAAEALRLARAGAQSSWPNHQAAFADLVRGRAPSAHWSIALDVAVALRLGEDGLVRPVVAPEAVEECWMRLPSPLAPSRYRGPTLLIDAAKEKGVYLTPQSITDMRAQLGDSLRYVALDQPHTIPADAPAELAATVSAFIAELS